jgi:hypothetical protein
MAGIHELDGTIAGRYTNNVIADNGHDGDPCNGDGIVLQGPGIVVGNTIVPNGDSDIDEHGIYASSVAVDYRIETNTLRDNAASGIKASGCGRVTGNVVSGRCPRRRLRRYGRLRRGHGRHPGRDDLRHPGHEELRSPRQPLAARSGIAEIAQAVQHGTACARCFSGLASYL